MSSMISRKSIKYVVLAGVFLLNLPGGFSVFYGNLHAYMVSYFHFCLPMDRRDLSPGWIMATCLAFIPIGSLVAGAMKFKLGLKTSVQIAILLYALGLFLSYISVQYSVWATTLTFGVVGMFGLGITEVLSYSFTSKWFPENQGFAGSVVGASSAVGAVLYNTIITTYINPDNESPNLISGDITYFTQAHLLDRIPMTFVLLGIISLVAQMAGFIMVAIPDFRDAEEENPILRKDHSQNKRCEESNVSYSSCSETSLSSISECAENESHPDTGKVIESHNPEKVDECISHKYSENYIVKNDIEDYLAKKYIEDCMTKTDTEKCTVKRDIEDGIAKKDEKECLGCVEVYIDKEFDLGPKDILKSVTLYIMWFSIMALSLALLIVSNYYKLFAQMWITDDAFLTLVGNSSALTNMLMRICMGYVSDKFRMKDIFIATLSTTSILMAFWYFTAGLPHWIYFICTNLLSGLTGCIFVLYPLASMKFFGLTYFATNTGIVMLATTLVEVGSAPIVTFLLSSFGWFGLFFTVSSFITASFIVTTLFMQREQVL